MRIADDGTGFDPSACIGTGIPERIVHPMEAVEGRALIESHIGEGTTVELYWGSVSVADVRTPESRRAGAVL